MCNNIRTNIYTYIPSFPTNKIYILSSSYETLQKLDMFLAEKKKDSKGINIMQTIFSDPVQ